MSVERFYTVERRRGSWAVYNPQGSKVASFFRYADAVQKAYELNNSSLK